jgi:hypothetical protein
MLTGDQYVEFLKVIVCSLSNLLPDEEEDANLVAVFRTFTDYYFLATAKAHSQHTINRLAAAVKEFYAAVELLRHQSPSNFGFWKFHSISIYESKIPEFGSARGFDTRPGEHAHIVNVKAPYKRSNKRDPMKQVLYYTSASSAFFLIDQSNFNFCY